MCLADGHLGFSSAASSEALQMHCVSHCAVARQPPVRALSRKVKSDPTTVPTTLPWSIHATNATNSSDCHSHCRGDLHFWFPWNFFPFQISTVVPAVVVQWFPARSNPTQPRSPHHIAMVDWWWESNRIKSNQIGGFERSEPSFASMMWMGTLATR